MKSIKNYLIAFSLLVTCSGTALAVPVEKLNGIIGEHSKDIDKLCYQIKHQKEYLALGIPLPKGILLHGPEGVGKSSIARAVAQKISPHVHVLSMGDSIDPEKLSNLFEQLREYTPCVLIIEEFDTIGRRKNSPLNRIIVNTLLTELDKTNAGDCVVIATTNDLRGIDKAIRRPGRFDYIIEVPLPSKASRNAILEYYLTDKTSTSINLTDIVNKSNGLSGAELRAIVEQATRHALENKRNTVTQADLTYGFKWITNAIARGDFGDAATASGARMHMPATISTKFKDVAGAHAAKEAFKDVIDFLKNPKKYAQIGATVRRGILLEGSPGNGKTLLAKALAGEANCPFFSISGSDFSNKWIGVGADRVRDLFAAARKHAPAIIFIDEIDSVGHRRSDDTTSGAQEKVVTLNQLLAEMDGFQTTGAPVIVIGATNRADQLDPALTRPGRFDKTVEVTKPDKLSREEILKLHAKKYQVNRSVNFATIALGTYGFSGADLANLLNEAALLAKKNNQTEITQSNLEEAIDVVLVGSKIPTLKPTKQDLKMTAYHEAGHALVTLLKPVHLDPIHKVTIAPRGHTLGVTYSRPDHEKYSVSKEQLEAQVMKAFGGKIAEELIFGANAVSTGCSSDLRTATSIIHAMVTEYGMSDIMGPIIYLPGYRTPELTIMIETEKQRIAKMLYKQTQELIKANKDKLDKLAHALIKHETLYAEEIYPLLNIRARA